MKIRNIYLGKQIPVICTTLSVLCIAVTLISQIIPSTYLAFAFTFPVKYPWQLITHIFLQGIPTDLLPPELPYSSMEITAGHLGYNLLLIIPFGILVEKVIRSKKFLALNAGAWAANMTANLILGIVNTRAGGTIVAAGASGIAFTYMPVGIYILFVMGRKYGFGKLFRQVSFYLLMGIAVPTMVMTFMPNIAGVTGIPSMIIHMTAIAVGIVFAIAFKGSIKSYFDETNIK